ncbi:hypothetical protein DMH04_08320 [Kibdelosporangium aridum]|uniref:CHAP domain-containing protein n=1 Tax=Kibdelosporangium aridum TaxID=2030 RepID=A0A428ZKN9_KIBAR|nr:hypothetical protein DMH04_08320 [Kibdelosporangium aridum]
MAVAAVSSVLVVSGAEAASARGVINTPDNRPQPVYTVEASRSEYHVLQRLAQGTGVTILCQTPGEWITGTHGRRNTWDFLNNGGMVPHTNVDTGSTWVEDLPNVPRCKFTTNPAAPKRANPHSYHEAIDQAQRLLNNTSFENPARCLAFVAEAYGWDAAGWNTAEIAGDYMERNGFLQTSGTPPRGSLVWYHNSSGSGHVMLSLGEGFLIGTAVNGRVGRVTTVDYRSGYRGYSIPYFPNGSGRAPNPPWPPRS